MPSQSSMDRRVVIPQHMQQAMAQHMQRSMPAHLRKYTQEGHGYIPQQAQAAIAQHMQKSMPAHMQKYVGAYVQQRVADPHLRTPSVLHQTSPQFAAPGPARQPAHLNAAHLPRQDHFHPSEDLGSVQPTAPGQPLQPLSLQGQPVAPVPVSQPGQTVAPTPQPQPGPAQPPSPLPTSIYPPGPAQPPPQPPAQPYDFITNAEKPANTRSLPSLPGVSPKAMRAAFMAGGLLALLIVFIIGRGLLSSKPNLTLFVGVAQDQQELIHLTNNASGQKGGISTNDQNFAATAQLSLTSSQASLIGYLANNKLKVSATTLGLKVDAATDTQLANALAATTYDQTFQQIMKTKLATYLSDLQLVYKQTNGVKGHALLSNDFKQAQLLQIQLNPPAQ